MKLDQYRLDAAELAAIDLEIAAMPFLPEPDQVSAALFALWNAIPGIKVDIAETVRLLAIYRRASATEAHAELFEALEAGDLSLEFPE